MISPAMHLLQVIKASFTGISARKRADYCRGWAVIMLCSVLFCTPAAAARPKIGLVFGGGGAKGAAEVGVLKVIQKAGIPIDYIAGTSIGSIVGGLYATGYSPEELDTLFRTQQWLSLLTDRREDLAGEPYKVKNGVTYIFGFPVMEKNFEGIGSIGALGGKKIETMLDSLLGYRGFNDFGQMKIPFRCVACDFKSAAEVVLSDGSPARAMRASMAIPGVFKPVNWGDYSLVDGGMINNLPCDVVKAMGADIIIAIDLQQDKPKKRKQQSTGLLGSLGDMLGVGGLVNWVASRPDVTKYYANVAIADIYINPPLPDYEATSFSSEKIGQMISIGERAAMKQWDALQNIKAMLRE